MGKMMKGKMIAGGIAVLVGLFMFPAFISVLFGASGPYADILAIVGGDNSSTDTTANALAGTTFSPILVTVVGFVPLLMIVAGLYVTGVFSWASGRMGRGRKRKRPARARVRRSAPRIVLARRR